MGRLQSSVGLITGTNIAGTVDQLIAISARPRDRLQARTDTLQQEQAAITSLSALVIGVQLAGNRLADPGLFRSTNSSSSNTDAVSVSTGADVAPGDYTVRTLSTAATHAVGSRQRFDQADQALGFEGTISVSPSGFLDQTLDLADLNEGRGIEAGRIRITDRSGASAEVDLSDVRTVDDVIEAINDADVDVRATTEGGAFKLIDETGQTASNLRVEQLGSSETAADLGLWGVDEAASEVTGAELTLPDGVDALRGTSLSQLGGGDGLGSLGNLNIRLSDGSSANINLSSATTTTEVIDAIEAAGLDLIVGLNDARNGFRIRDVSGGTGNLRISSSAASKLGLAADTSSDIVVGESLQLQTVTSDTLLSSLNQGEGVGSGGFSITDSNGEVGAVNLVVDDVKTVGELIDAINGLSIDVTASINDTGDGIAIVDNGGGESTLTVTDNGSGTVAASLGIAGTATDQTVDGSLESALVGTQADLIEITAEDSLNSIAEKINAGRYGNASVRLNDDGRFSLQVLSQVGGEAGRLAINTEGFSLDLQTTSRGQDASISVVDASGEQSFLQSADGVFKLNNPNAASAGFTLSSQLSDLGVGAGSFTVTDSSGAKSAVNLTVDGLQTVGELVDRINGLGLGVTASINESGDGLQIVDTAGGDGELVIEDVGNGIVAKSIGIAGTGTTQTINDVEVLALTGSAASNGGDETPGEIVFTLKELSDQPVTVSITEDPDAVLNAASSFVDQYNRLVDQLGSLTFFNEEDNEVGLLFGSSEALRIDTGFSRLLSGRIQGAGEIQSLAEVGIRLDEEGKLTLDRDRLSTEVNERGQAVIDFFTTEETGVIARVDSLADRLAGADNSLLITRTQTLTDRIERNTERIGFFNRRLDAERERLLNQFFSTEEAIAKLQSNLDAVGQIQPIQFPSQSS